MNSILTDVEELKKLIMNSIEYKNYTEYLKKVENNDKIKKLVNVITKKQKEIVRLENLGNDIENKNNELTKLYNELYSYEDYKNYILYSKSLNILISNIQNKFQEYFDNLVC